VLLKNVHLAPQWLVQLEKKLHSLQPHTNFRLFLTMEINSAVPVNLLRAGRIFVFEPPPGVKANLLRTFNTVSIVIPNNYVEMQGKIQKFIKGGGYSIRNTEYNHYFSQVTIM